MGKKATPKKARKTKVEVDPTLEYFDAINAKQRFIATALNMGWRLAVAFLVPVIIGAWIDSRYDSSPSGTLTGIIIGVVAAAVIVSNTVKEVNAETAEMDKKPKRRRKNA